MISTNPSPATMTPPPPITGDVPASSPPAAAATAAAAPTVPSGLRCKLTQALLEDAVLAEDGYTYNRPAWQVYVQAHPHALVSPKTVQPVSAAVMANRHLKNLASEWRTWHAAQPPHAEAFDFSDWVEDNLQGEVMREPVALPDGMVCDLATARDLIFGHPQHPGRSLVDATVTFDASQKVLRDLNVLELAEAALEQAPGTLSRTYVVPSIGAMLGSRATAARDPLIAAFAANGARRAHARLRLRLGNAAPAPRPRAGFMARVAMHLLVGAYIGIALAPLAGGIALAATAEGPTASSTLGMALIIFSPLWACACFMAPDLVQRWMRLRPPVAAANAA